MPGASVTVIVFCIRRQDLLLCNFQCLNISLVQEKTFCQSSCTKQLRQDTAAPVNVAQYTDEPNMGINMQLLHFSTQSKRMNDYFLHY